MNKTHLVLSGGGINGICMLGALKELDLKKISHIVGTSVGSIIGALMCMCSIDEIVSIISENADMLTSNFDVDIDNILESFGFVDPKGIIWIIEQVFENKLGISHITFAELYTQTNIFFVITGTNLSKQRGELFNKNTTPNMLVLDAIRISISIPFVFKKVMYNGDIYADGGISHMYPRNVFKDIDDSHVLCIYSTYNICIDDSNFIDYTKGIIYSIVMAQYSEVCSANNIIQIDATQYNLLGSITDSFIDTLIAIGKTEAEKCSRSV